MPPLGVWMGQLTFRLPSERLPLPRNNELTKVLLPHKSRRWSLLCLLPAEVCGLWSSGRDEFCWGCFWSPCVCSFQNLLGDAEASGDGEVSPGRSWICVWSSRYLIYILKERGHFFFSKWHLAGVLNLLRFILAVLELNVLKFYTYANVEHHENL